MSGPGWGCDLAPLFDDLFGGRRDGRLVLLKVYIDRGARRDARGVMCAAATLFRPERYKRFCREWNKMLRSLGAPYFHATDFYGGGGIYGAIPQQKRDAAARLIPRLIDESVSQVIAVSFLAEEWERLVPVDLK